MSNIKVTLGLQDRHIKRIEEERARWNNIGPEEAEAIFIHAFWVGLAKEFSWEPLTLALWYFRFHFTITTGEQTKFEGSLITEPAPGISLGCISPEARELLDTIMEQWEKHYAGMKEMHGDAMPETTFYGFAYWLVRWSGLIQPAATPTRPCPHCGKELNRDRNLCCKCGKEVENG